jgi:hypothetical protein
MLIDLVAGDAREIRLALALDDGESLDDRRRFDAHLALGAGSDLDWLDLFAKAARDETGAPEPLDFADSRRALRGSPSSGSDRIFERIDPAWIEAVAAIPDALFDRIAERWVELLDADRVEIEPLDGPVFRGLAAELVGFCRRGREAEDVVLAWSI